MRTRCMALTPDLVGRVHRALDDPGPEAHLVYHSDKDYDALVADLLAAHPGGETWLFAYGSLIWKPEIEHVEVRRGTARGWHRSFCFRVTRFRGTREQPGLMMSLDRGGQCRGVLFRLPPENLTAQVQRLVRREITAKPPNNVPRWIRVETEAGALRAVAFVMNRRSKVYVGRLEPEAVADTLAVACGHWGSGVLLGVAALVRGGQVGFDRSPRVLAPRTGGADARRKAQAQRRGAIRVVVSRIDGRGHRSRRCEPARAGGHAMSRLIPLRPNPSCRWQSEAAFCASVERRRLRVNLLGLALGAVALLNVTSAVASLGLWR